MNCLGMQWLPERLLIPRPSSPVPPFSREPFLLTSS